MNALAIILPAALVVGGLVTFVVLPLDMSLRLFILASDLAAAVVVGIVLWRRQEK